MFLLLVGVTALAGWLSWTRAEETTLGWDSAYAPFLFILGGWIICLTLQQYVRSLLAYRFGDRALRGTGYLRLNPFAFRELGAGLVLPVAYMLVGSFGLNGPAVHLDRSAVSGRGRRALVALGGLLTNAVLAAVLAAVVMLLVPEGSVTNNWAIVSLMFLCYLNVSAVLLNLLPVPGTDTFDAVAEGLDRWRPGRNAAIFGTVAIFAVVWCPPVNAVFMDGVFALFTLVDVNEIYLNWGQTFARPW
ncbi:site-2 protease family protein [Thermobifida halotolerans]|uniref:Site-2 protease family protein n=1 Tax=Thermobifida halotolerans TaxID=483545 RepID=A0A399G2U7_9ACTN|nr:site-2 protease family protein [Thermobifida halotolerans]